LLNGPKRVRQKNDLRVERRCRYLCKRRNKFGPDQMPGIDWLKLEG
jgi:hypothetical protein